MNFGVTDKSVNLIKWTVTIKITPDGETEKSKVEALLALFENDTAVVRRNSTFLEKGVSELDAEKYGDLRRNAVEDLTTEPLKNMIKVNPSENKISIKLTKKKSWLAVSI